MNSFKTEPVVTSGALPHAVSYSEITLEHQDPTSAQRPNKSLNEFIPFVPDYWELSEKGLLETSVSQLLKDGEGDVGEALHRGGSGTWKLYLTNRFGFLAERKVVKGRY